MAGRGGSFGLPFPQTPLQARRGARPTRTTPGAAAPGASSVAPGVSGPTSSRHRGDGVLTAVLGTGQHGRLDQPHMKRLTVPPPTRTLKML